MNNASGEWVCIRNYGTGLEADMALASLQKASIDARISSIRSGIFGAAFGGQVPGGYDVMVRKEDRDKAQLLLS